ncbi:MAG TPA: hypothetical protein PKE69_00110 [Pyrinomonadaceae bacterium]|nr:hypothetical protein [Pyrinomonadaceae bacterium]
MTRTIFENVDIIQVFQPNSLLTEIEIEKLIGVDAQQLLRMKPEEQYIVKESLPQNAIKLDYLKDEMFAGKFDANPYYRRQNASKDENNCVMLM